MWLVGHSDDKNVLINLISICQIKIEKNHGLIPYDICTVDIGGIEEIVYSTINFETAKEYSMQLAKVVEYAQFNPDYRGRDIFVDIDKILEFQF